ncbi:hypothetical protein A3Q56_05198 [Intoshia linei]|uniref:CCHC-type domain-containing protein n=1 Tax=Intoshia linei TaxID=1819745 RepID=A0A177AYH0_9BILA|nr:hypothetical protein A3Q56_05198 [Intoshia linei]
MQKKYLTIEEVSQDLDKTASISLLPPDNNGQLTHVEEMDEHNLAKRMDIFIDDVAEELEVSYIKQPKRSLRLTNFMKKIKILWRIGITDKSIVEAVNELFKLSYTPPARRFIRKVKLLVRVAFKEQTNIDDLIIQFVLEALKIENLSIFTSIVHLSTSIDKLADLLNIKTPIVKNVKIPNLASKYQIPQRYNVNAKSNYYSNNNNYKLYCDNKYNKEHIDPTCNKCGAKGHNEKFCNSNNNEYSLFYTKATINGKLMSCLIDTGSVASFLPNNFMPNKPTSSKYFSVTGSKL